MKERQKRTQSRVGSVGKHRFWPGLRTSSCSGLGCLSSVRFALSRTPERDRLRERPILGCLGMFFSFSFLFFVFWKRDQTGGEEEDGEYPDRGWYLRL